MESLPNFQINSPKGNVFNNQKKFQTANTYFILQINSNLALPMTSDADPKSFIHSFSNNKKTLELFNTSPSVDFSISHIMNELGNNGEIQNYRILLFFPIDKQDIFFYTH